MKFLFVCIGNSCRSQIAEAVAKHLGYDAESAGTEPAKSVHKNAIIALKSVGIDTSGLHPKDLDTITIDEHIVVSMGCGVKCPDIAIHHDFGLKDPKYEKIDYFVELVQIIKNNILNIVKYEKKLK